MKNVKMKIISALALAAVISSCGIVSQNVYAADSNIALTVTENPETNFEVTDMPETDLTKNVSTVDDSTIVEVGSDKQTEGSVKISVNENSATESNMVNPTFTVTNTGDSELDLTTLKIKYYYTEDGDVSENFNCYYSGTTDGEYRNITSFVQGNIVKMDESAKTEDADSYIELTFNGGSLDAGQSMILMTAVNKENWAVYDKSNDYSYNNADHATVYINDENVAGEAPVDKCLRNMNMDLYEVAAQGTVVSGAKGETYASIDGLTEGTDYIIDKESGIIVLLPSYVQQVFDNGGATLKLNYESGKYETLAIAVKAYDSTMKGTVTTAETSVKRGDKITIPVKLNLDGTPDCGLNLVQSNIFYDTDIFTDVQMTRGDFAEEDGMEFEAYPMEDVDAEGNKIGYVLFGMMNAHYGNIYETLNKVDNVAYLTLTVKEDAPLGETYLDGNGQTAVIGMTEDGHEMFYVAGAEFGAITVTE